MSHMSCMIINSIRKLKKYTDTTFNLMNPIYRHDPDFDINKFFNKLPIRVIGTPQYPLFYASDIADIVGIQNISHAIENFTGLEVLTDKVRRELGIDTYRDDGSIDNDIIILTLTGAVLMMIGEKTEISMQLRVWLAHLIHEAC